MAQIPSPPKRDKDIEENKVLAALSYLGILCLVPLLTKKDSRFTMFHARQGLVLFIIEVVLVFLSWIPFLSIILWLVWIGLVILSLIGLINALQGNYWKMPLLGDYAEKINI
jgi:uncharacterized membrane protein